jgi:molybdopterin-guanine dinucleotide biosynthesis protein A
MATEAIAPVAVPTAEQETRPEPLKAPVITERITGIVLAGGRSRRMGGRDKAWLTLAGKPLVRWALDALRMTTDEQIVVAREPQRYRSLGVPVVADHMPTRGPLAGIHAGLKASNTDLVLVLACDLPLARPELLAFLASAVGPADAAVPYVAEAPPPATYEAGMQPLCAAYRRACVASIEKLLLSGSYPVLALLPLIKARILSPEEWLPYDPDQRTFVSINTPDDLVAAAQLLDLGEHSGGSGWDDPFVSN